MESSLVIGLVSLVIGSFLTIVFGIPAWRSYRDNKNSKIFFFEKEKLKLYDDVIKNVPNLEITFKGNKVLTNMFILKGVFICSGKKAVNLTGNDDGIIMTINASNGEWHTLDVTGKTDHLTINHSISGQDLTIKFKQLKDLQYFIIECLGQADYPSITFNNMIGNVDGIIQATVGVEKINKRNLISWIGIWLFTLVFLWFCLK